VWYKQIPAKPDKSLYIIPKLFIHLFSSSNQLGSRDLEGSTNVKYFKNSLSRYFNETFKKEKNKNNYEQSGKIRK
jgi:hypothetical protein